MTVYRLFTPPAAAGAEFQPPKSCKIFLIGGGDEFDWERMDSIVKKYQQKFRKIKEEMSRWEDLQCLLISQFSNASSIIQRLQVSLSLEFYVSIVPVFGIVFDNLIL